MLPVLELRQTYIGCLSSALRGIYISHMCAFFFGKTCPERHDHQRFDGVPCGRDQWVLVGAVDSCTQERRGKRITVS